jgi:hypothetical protein
MPRLLGLLIAFTLAFHVAAHSPELVPTFNCLGIYWKPANGAADKAVAVAYRPAGQGEWREALPLWFDAADHQAEGAPHAKEYRGSIVNLKPDTSYEVRLTLAGTEPVVITTKTWSEQFKIARTVTLPADPNEAVVIKEGGSATDGYVLYTVPEGAIWDGGNQLESQVKVEASYVMLRGLTLKNAARHGILLGNVQHVVIENCDISGWGKIASDGWGDNLDAAIVSISRKLSHVVVQDCRLHHPRSDSNSWNEKRESRNSFHPIGPQAIVFRGSIGHHVIRRNRIYSDLQHMFNDGMGEVHNFSFDGFPGRDSDIHDNFISHCWDDGIEVEGADMNVRVWGNYIDTTYGAIGAASPSLGPLYIFRNVYGVSRKDEKTDENALRGHYLVKLGNEKPEWTQGRMYIFHNTTLQPPPFPEGKAASSGAQAGMVFTSDKKTAFNIISRNNLLDLRRANDAAIRDTQKTESNDWDWDMHNGRVAAKDGSAKNAINATPTYDRSADGRLWLRPGTPGHDAAVRLPNFNDEFVGAAPDMGAVETDDTMPKPATWPEFPEPITRKPTATQPATQPKAEE